MGILDDAIRQHLDLKRRQGAEEDELQRLEDEAFGPPSRPGEPDFLGSAAEGDGAVSSPDTRESVAVEEPPAAEPTAPSTAEGPLVPETGEEPAAAAPPDQPPIESLDTVEHPFEAAVEDTGGAEAVEQPLTDEEPATGDLPQTGEEEEVVEGEVTDPEGDGEDVLEETPEFLRDQPEDDELWFEQGEPKDFDF